MAPAGAASLFLFLCATADAQSPSLFFVPPSYPGNGQTVSADFNGDGKPDLVAADGTVLLGKGDGTFTTGIPLSVPGSLIATGDFNGDGKPDVLIVSFSSTNLYIFLGNGDGTFRTPVITNMGTSLSSVVVADLNGDGKLDVLGTIPGAALLVLLGKGDGTFGAGVTYPVLSNSTNFLAVGDFNADGKVDIALAANSGTSAPGSVGVLLGKGDGTFQAAVTSTGVSNPVGMAAGDFNGDGKLDLLVSDSTTGQTFLLAGNGNGTFQTPTAATSKAGLLGTADVNGDGKPDAIIVTDPFVAVFLGKGDGTFTAENTYHVASEGNSESITIGDFNGDGRLDVALDNTILLGNGDGSFQGNAAISLNNLGLGPGTDGDFNGDGNPDIAVASANNASDLNILLGDGTGKFSVSHTYTLPLPAYSIAAADFNGDGKLDLVFITSDPITGNWSFYVMLGNGDGSFGSPTAFPQGVLGQLPIPIAVADLNGDHIPDLLVLTGTLNVFLGKGDGTFAPAVSYFAGAGPTSFVVGDFNNDGIADAAVASSAGIGILLGKGDGSFQAATFPVSGVTQVLAVADLNGDGTADLVASTNGTLQVLLGNGNGTFQTLPSANQRISNVVAVADVNLDGKLDLMAGNGLNVFLGNGDGTFGIPIVIVPAVGDVSQQAVGLRFVLIADYNHDKRTDVAVDVEGPTSGVVSFLNISQPPGPDFQITASAPSPVTVAPGSSATSTVTLTPIGGFAGGVTLSCSGLPSASNCGFAPSSLPTGSGTSKLTITTAAATPVGTYPVLIMGTSSSITHERVITLTVAASAGATTVTVAPTALTFGQEPIGTASAAQSLQLTNSGSAALTISGVAIAGPNAGDFAQTNTCGASLAAAANCQISVTFTPTGMGGRSASISINDNATGSPQVVALTGTGPDFSIASTGAASATVAPGQTATYTMSVASGGGFNQSVALTCSGAPSGSTCTVSPTPLQLGGSPATATVTVTTTAPSKGTLLPFGNDAPRTMSYRPTLLLFTLLSIAVLLSLFLWRRDQRLRAVPALTFALLLCLGSTMTSCGGGSSGGGGGTVVTGTQAGTYTITVSASAPAGSTTLNHSAKLTLIVQ